MRIFNDLFFFGEVTDYLDELVNELLHSDATLGSTLSRQALIDLLIPVIRDKKLKGETFSRDECEGFRINVANLPVEEHRVLRDIYGASISESGPPLRLGCFTIYDWERHKDLVASPVTSADAKHELLVECRVEARDMEKAVELADIQFSRLELVIRFMIGPRTERYDVGILNYRGSGYRKHYAFSKRAAHAAMHYVGSTERVKLDDNFFSNPDSEFLRLVKLLDCGGTRLERKILRCVEWIGQAIAEPSPASAFVKAATALEVLFSTTEKGLITPSIMAQISESCAMILGDSIESCLEIEATVKRLYGLRSAVVHSGKEDISSQELGLFIGIARSAARKLLSDGQYREMENIETLHKDLKRRRYNR